MDRNKAVAIGAVSYYIDHFDPLVPRDEKIHALRMENITKRMMVLALQKKTREDKRNAAEVPSPRTRVQ